MTGSKRRNFKKHSSKGTRITMFLDGVSEFSIDKLTVEDVLYSFDWRNYEKYFDPQKILAYLEKHSKLFEEEILSQVFCPNCKSSSVKEIGDNSGGSKKYYRCLDCKRKFKPNSFVKSHFSDWVIPSILCCVVKGEKPQDIVRALITEATNRRLDFGCKEKIPDEKTLYDIIEKCARKFEKFNDLMIRLIGGLQCKKLFCDDLFARRRRRRQKIPHFKRKSTKKPKRFYYAILTMDADFDFIIVLHIARFRDKCAFRVAFAETEEKLRNLPDVIRGDKLSAMEKAAESHFPKNEVKHDFRQLKPWEKGELNKIERRIRDVRRTIRKRQKSGSIRVLENYAKIALIGLDYLKPMDKALKGKSPAQAVGIPYPLYQWDWRKFMIWVDWVFGHVPEILKAGLKQIPETSLVPSVESNEKIFVERMKLKKRKKR